MIARKMDAHSNFLYRIRKKTDKTGNMPTAMNVADKVLSVEREMMIPAIKDSNIAAINQWNIRVTRFVSP